MKLAQLCLTVCGPMDYTVHGILQARILEWVAYPFSRGSSWPRNEPRVSCIAGGFFTNWAIRKAHSIFLFWPHRYCSLIQSVWYPCSSGDNTLSLRHVCQRVQTGPGPADRWRNGHLWRGWGASQESLSLDATASPNSGQQAQFQSKALVPRKEEWF